MKKFIGLFVLVIILAMISGCTQPAKPAAVTTPEQTMVPTVPPTETTRAPLVVSTPEVTPVVTSEIATMKTTVPPTPKPVMTPSTKITTIYIRNNLFVPNELMVLPGTGITWVNDDATVHAIKTTGNHKGMFNTGDIMPGSRWGYTYGENEGTFEYMDTYSNSTGVIIVKKGEALVGNPTVRPSSTV